MERIRTVRYPGIGFVYNYPDIPMITMAFLFSDWSAMPALDIANKCTDIANKCTDDIICFGPTRLLAYFLHMPVFFSKTLWAIKNIYG